MEGLSPCFFRDRAFRLSSVEYLTVRQRRVIEWCASVMHIPAEIVLPATNPETEWVRGRALKKVSPTFRHARLQLLIGGALTAWARGRGRVGSEWRFRVNPPGGPVRPLVPDVAYLSYARMPLEADAEAQVPLGAPSVAVEILSQDDRTIDVDDKIATYLSAGCELVIIVDPHSQTITAYDGRVSQTFVRGNTFTHPAVPDFSFDLAWLFEEAKR